MIKHLLILATCASPLTSAMADSLVVELNEKVEYLDNQNKELLGKVEELSHKLNVLSQKYETFSSDVEMRLSGSSAPTTQASSGGPVSLTGQTTQPSSPTTPNTSSGPQALAAAPQPQEKVKQDPKQQYENARSLLEQGNYEKAGTEFAAFIQDHPQDEHIPDANYWLGVSYLVRGHYDNAAGTFAGVYKNYPQSRKAPDALLKMAKSLYAMDRKQDACTTLTQLKTSFPGKLDDQYQKEWTKLGCQ